MVDRQELHNAYSLVWQYAVDRLGYEVLEGSDLNDVCMSDTKQIHICSRNGIENKFQKEFPAHAACGYDGRKNKTDKYRISLIEEEFEAWKRGKRLAKRLGIQLDEARFEKHKAQCLMSYINWGAGQYD
jgi:endonuclease I